MFQPKVTRGVNAEALGLHCNMLNSLYNSVDIVNLLFGTYVLRTPVTIHEITHLYHRDAEAILRKQFIDELNTFNSANTNPVRIVDFQPQKVLSSGPW